MGVVFRRVRDADGDLGAASGCVGDRRASSMRSCNCCDDREPEARSAARSARVRAAEALEGLGCEVGWESGSFVGHVQLQPVAALRGRDTDCSGSVTEGVLDQVAERLLDPESVDSAPAAATFGLDRSAGFSGAASEAHGHAVEELVELDVVQSDREGSLVESCEQQKVLGELREAVALVPDRAQGGLQLVPLARTLEGELDLRPEVGERCSQLVARVGDEAALSLDRGLEPAEHLVERLAQACHLVP